jgi:hypothetical protein
MAYFEMIVSEKDEVFIPSINRLAKRSEGNYYTAATESGTLYELNFPDKKRLDDFKTALQQRLSKKIE